jgi:hypothetical protein
VDNGGAIDTVSWTNITGRNLTNGWYAYLGDADPGNAMADTKITNAHMWIVSGNAFQNAVSGAPIVLNNFGCTSATNCVVGNFNKQTQMSGFSIWSGNTNDAALYSDGAIQGTNTIGYTAEVPDGSGTFRAFQYSAGFTTCNGTPGIGLFQSTAAAARYGASYPGTPQHCWANSGEYRQTGRHTILSPSGQEGIRIVPASDSDGSDAAITATNAAESSQVWAITKGGWASFTDVNTTGAYHQNGNAGLSATITVKGSDGNNCTLTFAGGILTEETCP